MTVSPGNAPKVAGVIECRSRTVVAGLAYADAVAALAGAEIVWRVASGQTTDREPLGTIRGSLASVLCTDRKSVV